MITAFRALGVVAALSFPTFAHSVEFNSAATLGFGSSNLSNGLGKLKSYTLDIANDVDFGNGFSLTFDLGAAKVDPSMAANDVTANYAALDLNYRFTSGLSFGAYAEHNKIEALGTSLKLRSYGVSAGYGNDMVEGEVFYGKSTTSPALPGGADIRDAGLSLTFHATPQLDIAANFIQTRFSAGGGNLDVSVFDLGATYAVNDQFSVFGGFSKASLDILPVDLNTVGLGASYAMGSGSFPVIVSLELARTTINTPGVDPKMDTVRLGVTVPFGKSGTANPLNSVASNAMRTKHSAISSGILAAF